MIRMERTFRIGFQESPPYHFPDAQGGPAGPAVDVVKEAARRKNISLEWIYAPEGPEKALDSGTVDLWPIMGDIPERRRFLYITAHWAKMTYGICFPRLWGSNGQTLVQPTMPAVVGVCSRLAQAGLLVQSSMLGPAPAECPQVWLRTLPIPGGTFWFGIGASKKLRDAQGKHRFPQAHQHQHGVQHDF